MAETTDKQTFWSSFGLLVPAVAFSLLMFGWLGWHVQNTFMVGRELKDDYVRSEELRGRICELHQRLAANALMAVASGQQVRENRHREMGIRLDALIDDARKHEAEGYNVGALWSAHEVHDELRAQEKQAFDLARNGDRQAALALLSDETYEELQAAFSEAAARFVADYRDLLNDRLLEERDKEVVSLVVAFGIFSVTLAIWIFLMNRLQRREMALAVEVAEREKAEFALRQREQILSQAQEIAHLGSYERDAVSGWESWSDEFYRIIGYAPGAFPARQELLFERIHPDHRARLSALMREALAAHAGYDAEVRIVRPNGEERSVWIRAKLERDPDGKVIREVGTLYDSSERKQIEERLEQSRQELRSLAVHLLAVRERERAAVAKEIHDEVGQTLAALKMDLFRLKNRLPKVDHDQARWLDSMLDSVDVTLDTVQRVMSELHPPVLDDLGLTAAAEWQLQQFQKRTRIRCNCECEELGKRLSPEQNLALFRVLQEALVNVEQHAKASRVSMRITRMGDDIEISGADARGTRVLVRMPMMTISQNADDEDVPDEDSKPLA